jgi:GGDEF domain-containing protein
LQDLFNNHLLLLTLLATTILGLGIIVLQFTRRRRKPAIPSNGRMISPEMNLGAVPTFRRTLPQLSNELARVRRYNRPLSVVVLRIESDQLLLNLKRSLASETGNGSASSYSNIMQTIQLVFSLVGSILSESLRDSDIACYDVANNQYIILLAESDKARAAQTVQRLKKLLFKRTAGHLLAGIAEFPQDGLIIEDLVKVAVASCQQKPEEKTIRNASDDYDNN